MNQPKLTLALIKQHLANDHYHSLTSAIAGVLRSKLSKEDKHTANKLIAEHFTTTLQATPQKRRAKPSGRLHDAHRTRLTTAQATRTTNLRLPPEYKMYYCEGGSSNSSKPPTKEQMLMSLMLELGLVRTGELMDKIRNTV
jgi:hypothetical protein